MMVIIFISKKIKKYIPHLGPLVFNYNIKQTINTIRSVFVIKDSIKNGDNELLHPLTLKMGQKVPFPMLSQV